MQTCTCFVFLAVIPEFPLLNEDISDDNTTEPSEDSAVAVTSDSSKNIWHYFNFLSDTIMYPEMICNTCLTKFQITGNRL